MHILQLSFDNNQDGGSEWDFSLAAKDNSTKKEGSKAIDDLSFKSSKIFPNSWKTAADVDIVDDTTFITYTLDLDRITFGRSYKITVRYPTHSQHQTHT
jgi:hypothetical protein